MPAEERIEAVHEIVKEEAGRNLPLSQPVPSDESLEDLGMDSLMAINLRNALGKRFDTELPLMLAFDHPTLKAISEYIVDLISSAE